MLISLGQDVRQDEGYEHIVPTCPKSCALFADYKAACDVLNPAPHPEFESITELCSLNDLGCPRARTNLGEGVGSWVSVLAWLAGGAQRHADFIVISEFHVYANVYIWDLPRKGLLRIADLCQRHEHLFREPVHACSSACCAWCPRLCTKMAPL